MQSALRAPWLPAGYIVLLAALIAGCSVISIDLTPRLQPLEETTVEGSGDAKILLMDISGFISDESTSTSLTIGAPPPRAPLLVRIREELKKASRDKSVRGLVLRINSPGGTVTASDIVFQELQMFRGERKIPMVAVMMDVAASGGYYVALAADRIVAHPTSVTGSIGVVMVTMDAQGLLRKIGVSTAVIKSGEFKDMGSPFRPLTAEERGIFQGVIDGLQRQFVDKVVERRKIPIETARTLADGRVYTAEQALGHKLIDRIGYMPDALAMTREAMGVDEARVIVYRRPRVYRATYYAGAEASSSALEASVGQLAALAAGGPRFLYLWSP